MQRKYNNGDWTAARFNSFVKSALRSASQRWPPRYKVLKKAAVGKKTNIKTGRLAEHYLCNSCKKEFPLKEVNVDHITPVVPLSGFTTWDEVIHNMFCEEDNLQILCKHCHTIKTNAEKRIAKENKYNE